MSRRPKILSTNPIVAFWHPALGCCVVCHVETDPQMKDYASIVESDCLEVDASDRVINHLTDLRYVPPENPDISLN